MSHHFLSVYISEWLGCSALVWNHQNCRSNCTSEEKFWTIYVEIFMFRRIKQNFTIASAALLSVHDLSCLAKFLTWFLFNILNCPLSSATFHKCRKVEQLKNPNLKFPAQNYCSPRKKRFSPRLKQNKARFNDENFSKNKNEWQSEARMDVQDRQGPDQSRRIPHR